MRDIGRAQEQFVNHEPEASASIIFSRALQHPAWVITPVNR